VHQPSQDALPYHNSSRSVIWSLSSLTAQMRWSQDRTWHICAGFRLADLRPLLGVERPLDAGSTALRSGTAVLDSVLVRPILTQSEHSAHMNSNPLDTVLDSQ